MNPLSLSDIAHRIGATLRGGDPSRLTSRVTQDTRQLHPGDLYLALRGENFDGHAFVPVAAANGAVGAIIAAGSHTGSLPNFTLLEVSDPLRALHSLAASWRAELHYPIVGLTGSSGKTSTKQFLAAILAEAGPVCSTPGNLNNHIGLPLTILSAQREDQFGVFEMGMNHPGEIAPLATLARPDHGIITNIGTAHIEFFPDRAGIAQEKAELFRAVAPSGACFYPAQDDFATTLAEIAETSGSRACPVSLDSGSPHAQDITPTENGTRFLLCTDRGNVETHLAVPGLHMVQNVLLAAAAALRLGLSPEQITAGLHKAKLVGGRLNRKVIRGLLVIDDSYNANPDSMEAALKTLAAMPLPRPDSRRLAVLGRMGELGHYSAEGYARVGRCAAATVDELIAAGPATAPLAEAARTAGLSAVHHLDDPAAAAVLIRSIARPGDALLLKGSRTARMEEIIPLLS
jgi:UDP-N-acetylmuramoyl-tripeptide--D-alanyl-D-alanine ligase